MQIQSTHQSKAFNTWCIKAFIFWTALLFASALFFIKKEWHNVEILGKELGLSSLQKDYTYRAWNAQHGGVYVPVTESTPPNPYLAHIAHRDIQIEDKTFTMINPAYMTRQVHELGLELYGSRGHITSLNVIRPENKPDPWEVTALKQFEDGAEDVAELVRIDGQPYMRVMTPMVTQESCLKCHADQGYRVGDIRGGISVSVPVQRLTITAKKHIIYSGLLHALIYIFGTTGLLLFHRSNTRHFYAQTKAEDDLAEQQMLLQGVVDNISNGIAIYEITENSDDFIIKDINPAGLATAGLERHDVVGKKVTTIFPGVEEMGLLAVLKRVSITGKPESYPVSLYEDDRISFWLENYMFKLPTGEITAVFNDITEKKRRKKYYCKKQRNGKILSTLFRILSHFRIGRGGLYAPTGPHLIFSTCLRND